MEMGSRSEKQRRCIEKREKRGEESVGKRYKKKEKSRRVDWRGKKSRQSLEYQALLWPREKEERRGCSERWRASTEYQRENKC